jgi:5-dehydro-2-deoxygluconokinase
MGRAAVDLYSNQFSCRLEDSTSFSKYVGGCPANIAIGTSRLGLDTGILTRVGDEAMGRFVRETLDKEGVDTTAVQIDDKRLTALAFLGVNPPDNFPLVFYRENCADMAINPTQLTKELFAQYKSLLITGTHCSTPYSFQTTKTAIKLAKATGCKIILDIDYRPVLWNVVPIGDGESREGYSALFGRRLASLLADCDLIVGTEEEILMASMQDSLSNAIRYLQEMSSGLLVQKRGEEGCIVHSPNSSSPLLAPAFKSKVLNVLGAGDAFMSGFLRGWLKDYPLEDCCRLANANGALVVTRHGCSPEMPFWDELNSFMKQPSQKGIHTLHLNLEKKRKAPTQPLAILAFDHRKYFKDFPTDQVIEFKNLLYQTLNSKLSLPIQKGFIIDEIYGSTILASLPSMWCARPIEESGNSILKFQNFSEAALILKHWPTHHIVKVLVQLHSDNIESLQHLQNACLHYGHHLLIEPLSDTNENYISQIQTLLEAGLSPQWWKLPPFSKSVQEWTTLFSLIEHYNPHTFGCLLLGQNTSTPELLSLIKTLAPLPLLKGFAVGRAIWHEAAQEWFSQTHSTTEIQAKIWNNYSECCETFLNAKQIEKIGTFS